MTLVQDHDPDISVILDENVKRGIRGPEKLNEDTYIWDGCNIRHLHEEQGALPLFHPPELRKNPGVSRLTRLSRPEFSVSLSPSFTYLRVVLEPEPSAITASVTRRRRHEHQLEAASIAGTGAIPSPGRSLPAARDLSRRRDRTRPGAP